MGAIKFPNRILDLDVHYSF